MQRVLTRFMYIAHISGERIGNTHTSSTVQCQFMHQKYHEQTKNIQNIMLITLISLSICIYLLYCNCACTSEFMDTCCLWGSTGTDIRNAARFCKISSFFNCFIWSNNVNQHWGVLIKLGWCIEHAGTSAVKMMTNIAYIRDQHLNGLHPHQCLSLAEAVSIVTTWGSLATLVSAFMWRGGSMTSSECAAARTWRLKLQQSVPKPTSPWDWGKIKLQYVGASFGYGGVGVE